MRSVGIVSVFLVVLTLAITSTNCGSDEMTPMPVPTPVTTLELTPAPTPEPTSVATPVCTPPPPLSMEDIEGFIWQRTNGPGGGVIRGALAISATHPNILYAGTDISGVFRTNDCGEHWIEMSVPRGPIEGRSIAIDHSNSNIVYVGQGDGIYRTTDGGESWSRVFSTGVFCQEAAQNAEVAGCGVTSITISRHDNDIVYAGCWGGQLIRSNDGGQTWKRIDDGLETTHIVSKILIDPSNPDSVYVATGYWDTDGTKGSDGTGYPGPGEGVFKSVDGGQSWAAINNGLPSWLHRDRGRTYITINDLEMSPSDPSVLYALTASVPGYPSIYRSVDGGEHWAALVSVEFGSAESVAIDPKDASVLYVSNSKGRIRKSTDGGETWRPITGTALKTNPFFIDMIIDPVNTNNIFGASYYKGIVKSNDAGETWVRANNGINIANSYFVAVDPSDSDIVYAGALESVLFGTGDAGENWQVAGLEFMGLGYVYGILVDPTDPNVVYAGTGWQGGTATEGVFKTSDKGETWMPVNNGIGESPIYVEDGALKLGCEPGISCAVFYNMNEMSNQCLEDPYHVESTTWIPVIPGEIYTVNYKYKGCFDAFFVLVKMRDGTWELLHEDNHWEDCSVDFRAETFSFRTPEDAVAIALRIDSLSFLSYFDDISLSIAGISDNVISNGDFSEAMDHWSYPQQSINRNIYFLAMDPKDHNTIYAGTEDGYVYKSENGGERWEAINGILTFNTINTIAMVPRESDTVFVGTNSKYADGGGIFKSEDAGDTWSESERYSSEGERGTSMSSPRYCYAIAVDPDNRDIMYAGEARAPILFKSVDAGATWHTKLDLRNDSRLDGMTWIEVDPSAPSNVYAGLIGEEGTIYASRDRGETWAKLNEYLSFTTVWGHSQLQIDPLDSEKVYAGTWGGGTYKTTDGGHDWLLLDENHTFSPTCLAISNKNPNIIYACDRVEPRIHRSDDAGNSWYTYYDFGGDYMLTSAVAIDPEDPDLIYAAAFKPPMAHGGPLVKIQHGQVVADLSHGLPRAVLEIEIDAHNPDVIYVSTHIHGVFKSIDGGENWEQLDDKGTGLPRTGIYDIDIDPSDDNTLYATALCGELPGYMLTPSVDNLEGKCGVYKSTDGGAHWTLVLETISEARGIDIDPVNNNNLYVADMMGGVWVSNNGGQNWRQENHGLGSVSMTSVKASDDHIYASTQGSGVYSGAINHDGSITWDASRSNKPKAHVYRIQIEVDPRNPNRIYASAYPGGMLRSDDGGRCWSDKNFLTPSIEVADPFVQGYYSFDINPQDPDNVWLGAYGKGMFVSYDGMDFDMFANGEDGTMAGKKITCVRIHPGNPSEIYAGTDEGVFVTRDAGRHWVSINDGLIFKDIVSIALDHDGSTLFAGTRGAGLWRTSTTDIGWEQVTKLSTEPRVCWIKVDPVDTDIIYVALNPSGMYKTSDGGSTWREINVGLTNTIAYPIEVNPSNTQEVYVGTGYARDPNSQSGGGKGIYRSDDAGEHWEPANGGLTEDIIVNIIKFDPRNSEIIYIGTEGWKHFHEGLFMSKDKGETWVSINNNGIEEFPIYALEFDSSGDVAYVGTGYGGVWKGIRK